MGGEERRGMGGEERRGRGGEGEGRGGEWEGRRGGEGRGGEGRRGRVQNTSTPRTIAHSGYLSVGKRPVEGGVVHSFKDD